MDLGLFTYEFSLRFSEGDNISGGQIFKKGKVVVRRYIVKSRWLLGSLQTLLKSALNVLSFFDSSGRLILLFAIRHFSLLKDISTLDTCVLGLNDYLVTI